MSKYLERALRWLGAYSVPVVLLSATLPIGKRRALINAYLGKKAKLNTDSLDYPLISLTNGDNIVQTPIPINNRSSTVQIKNIDENDLVNVLDEMLSDGGCAGIIVNTVKRAQQWANILRNRFGNSVVRLYHSRFLAPDRAENEGDLLRELGKQKDATIRPQKRIVIGSQVLEQSLDIDFDVLITDVCPMDLLLQRIGRLQRHKRDRGCAFVVPQCFVINWKSNEIHRGSALVYKKYPLLKTKALLPDSICLPGDISPLVQSAYGPDTEDVISLPGYAEAKAEWDASIQNQEKRACDFQISEPWTTGTLVHWLHADASEESGEASVRDTDESLEVLAIQEIDDRYCFFPWVKDKAEIPLGIAPEPRIAKALACQSLHLPPEPCYPNRIGGTIAELKDLCAKRFSIWQESAWLKGALFLVFDSAGKAELNGFTLHYNRDDGLTCEITNQGDSAND